jgi:dienelactone hydrolase
VYRVTFDPKTLVATTSPLFYDEASATVANTGTGEGKTVKLKLTDPDSNEDVPTDAARALVEQAKDAELSLYPGDQHLFADSSLPAYDASAAALLTERILNFLNTR